MAREPHITDCCGGHFCKACIQRPKEDRQPCPSCGQDKFSNFLDKGIHKRILALQVCCMMKGRGCEWEGRLEDLQAHLDVDTNDCQYVDVVCSNECGQSVPRLLVPSHLADSCPNRDFFCHHCNFTATYCVVRYDHWPECPRFPVPCPNGCSVGAVERADMEDHIKVCLLQEVACGLSRAGCQERFLLQDEDGHMEDNTQRHILLMAAANHRMGAEFEEKLQEQKDSFKQALEEKGREIQALREEKGREIQAINKEKGREVKALEAALQEREKEIQVLREEKDKQAGEIREEVARVTLQLQFLSSHLQLHHVPYQSVPPVCVSVNNFGKLKADRKTWTSPDLYTHERGYKIFIMVNFGTSSIGPYMKIGAKPGEYDAQLKWPARASFTVQLLNVHRDHAHHIQKRSVEQWVKPTGDIYVTGWVPFIHYTDLDWNADKQTQYLKNDSLVFRLTEVEVEK